MLITEFLLTVQFIFIKLIFGVKNNPVFLKLYIFSTHLDLLCAVFMMNVHNSFVDMCVLSG